MNINGINIESLTEDLVNVLGKHGLHIAPLPAPAPPPQTEAERLVRLAKTLPQEAWAASGWELPDVNQWGRATMFGDNERLVFGDEQFRPLLLGVMAAYVGTEPNAHVVFGRNGVVIWTSCLDDAFHAAPDLLTAYRDCCLAIARKRGGA